MKKEVLKLHPVIYHYYNHIIVKPNLTKLSLAQLSPSLFLISPDKPGRCVAWLQPI